VGYAVNGQAHGRHLANTAERLCVAAINGSAAKGGDATSFQITLDSLLIFSVLCLTQPNPAKVNADQ